MTQDPNFSRPPKKSLTIWATLLPLLLGVALLWQRFQPPSDNAGRPAPTDPTVGNNSPGIGQPTPDPQVLSRQVVLYLPNTNAELKPKTVTISAPGNPKDLAKATVNELLHRADRIFPTGTKLLSLGREGTKFRVNFNRAFANEEFWSQGDSFGILATGAVTNTLAALDTGKLKPVKVSFLVDGKPMQTLGELDMSEPFEPNETIVGR